MTDPAALEPGHRPPRGQQTVRYLFDDLATLSPEDRATWKCYVRDTSDGALDDPHDRAAELHAGRKLHRRRIDLLIAATARARDLVAVQSPWPLGSGRP